MQKNKQALIDAINYEIDYVKHVGTNKFTTFKGGHLFDDAAKLNYINGLSALKMKAHECGDLLSWDYDRKIGALSTMYPFACDTVRCILHDGIKWNSRAVFEAEFPFHKAD